MSVTLPVTQRTPHRCSIQVYGCWGGLLSLTFGSVNSTVTSSHSSCSLCQRTLNFQPDRNGSLLRERKRWLIDESRVDGEGGSDYRHHRTGNLINRLHHIYLTVQSSQWEKSWERVIFHLQLAFSSHFCVINASLGAKSWVLLEGGVCFHHEHWPVRRCQTHILYTRTVSFTTHCSRYSLLLAS